MKAKGMILAVMMMLMCCSGAWAGDKVYLFEGDSLAQLNKKQKKLLKYAMKESGNDSVIFIPMEFNLLMNDTTDFVYVGYPEWDKAYFMKFGRNKKYSRLEVPVYAETPYGVIRVWWCFDEVRGEKMHYVCTQLPKNVKMGGSLLYSEENGRFLRARMMVNNKQAFWWHGEDDFNESQKIREEEYYKRKKKNAKLVYINPRGRYNDDDIVPRPYTALEIASGYPQKFLPKSGL